ncbi:MAG TPA: hypothetical protein VH478_21820 [Trebonia sp.]|jgi:hypothetical protein|nr:hypothetical protein [Trebonia sp.]
MIVRIVGEGQFEIGESAAARLEELDDELDAAVQAKDDAKFKAALSASVEVVRSGGTPLPAESLQAADIILPASDADMDEVLKLLNDGQLES